MKKQFFLIAAALLLGMTACQKEEQIIPINGNDIEENVMVKSAADLIGTNWTYVMNDTISLGDFGCDSVDGIVLNFEFGLSFDSSYAHLTFPENVVAFNLMADGDEYGLQEVASMDFAYTYDPTTQTGALTANAFDEDGEPSTCQIPFTYNTTSDAITIVLHIADEGDEDNTYAFPLVFTRAI
jgi:hypothetical protein